MKGGIEFDRDAQGRTRIADAPGKDELVVFTMNYLLNRRQTDTPGVCTYSSLTPGSIIQVTAFGSPGIACRIDSIDDWAEMTDGTIVAGYTADTEAGLIVKATRMN